MEEPAVTKPKTGSTEAIVASLLLHVPLGDPLSLSCVVCPGHKACVPTIATGVALTVNVIDTVLPQPSLYLIVLVPPFAVTPAVTRPPVASIDATVGALLLHVPLGDPLSLNCVVKPEHKNCVPTIATGVALTVNVIDTVLPQPSL
jgi:hypothetical protein